MLDLASKKHSAPVRGWWLSDPASNRKAFGVVLHLTNGKWTVARTLAGSPAENAGVTSGEHFASVDGYEVGPGKGEFTELHALMMEDTSTSHSVTFYTAAGVVNRDIGKESLHQLLERDFDNGKAALGYCKGCRTCKDVTIGATDCSSGCPGSYCTIG